MEFGKHSIVYLIPHLSGSGGMESVLCAKTNYLADTLGWTVSIITSKQNQREFFFKFSDKISFYDVDTPTEGQRYIFRYAKRLKKLLKKIQPDFCVSTHFTDLLVLPFLRDNSKKIGELHFTFDTLFWWYNNRGFLGKFIRRIKLWEYKTIASKLDAFVVLTNYEKDILSRSMKNVHHIYNPSTFVTNSKSNLQNKSFIYVGRFNKEKNAHSLIPMWAEVVKKHPDWILNLYGEGPFEEIIKSSIHKYGLSENIFIKGTTTNIIDAMVNSSGLLLPSLTEGLGLVLIEANSVGLPVISYDCNGPKEIIDDGKNGFLIKSFDSKTFVNKIIFLIENESLRLQMGAYAIEMSKRYSIDYIINQWISLFNSL